MIYAIITILIIATLAYLYFLRDAILKIKKKKRSDVFNAKYKTKKELDLILQRHEEKLSQIQESIFILTQELHRPTKTGIYEHPHFLYQQPQEGIFFISGEKYNPQSEWVKSTLNPMHLGSFSLKHRSSKKEHDFKIFDPIEESDETDIKVY